MASLGSFLATTPLGTALKTFVGAVLVAFLADLAGSTTLSLARWQTWVTAGLTAAVPVVINALNPSDARYGRGSEGGE